jgi:hypothetical protein
MTFWPVIVAPVNASVISSAASDSAPFTISARRTTTPACSGYALAARRL